jgi:hypothetical protein
MNVRKIQPWVLTLVLVCVSSVYAQSVFLNGARINGVKNKEFKNVTVKVDANGDFHIDAPGYAVSTNGGTTQKFQTPAVKTATSMSQRYWLVKEENYPGKTQYDIDIYINSVWYKRIRSNGEQDVFEITKHLNPGSNVLHFAAIKNIGTQRKSFSPQVYMRIIVGEGNIGGNNVMIENPIIQYTRTASETKNFNDEYTITAR